jgi:hypothetical protein
VRLVADENCDFSVVIDLRLAGYDVVSITNWIVWGCSKWLIWRGGELLKLPTERPDSSFTAAPRLFSPSSNFAPSAWRQMSMMVARLSTLGDP